jgi:NADH-quinone oxidoreductase subunit H
MMVLRDLIALTLFPGGLFVLGLGLACEWADRKLIARLQHRVGPRWFQTVADAVKLISKEEIVPDGANPATFHALPAVALAGGLTASLYVPLAGTPALSLPGDLVITITLLGLLSLCTGVAGANTASRFALAGATRALTQLFSYEAPLLLALLGPAVVAGTWQIDAIVAAAGGRWLVLTQPIGFVVALIGLMGKLELPPFDAPEAGTEIVAGPLTEYSGRGLALFRLSRNVTLAVGLTLIAALYLGGIQTPAAFVAKAGGLLVIMAALQALFARLRIDQTVGLWWRYGAVLALGQWLVMIAWKVASA